MRYVVARLAVALLFLAAPARAASVIAVADFNGDGVSDRVVIAGSPDRTIVVQVSGAEPQILRLHSAAISVIVADIDHDGHLDLSALSEHRGVKVWLNQGGHGRFAALRKKHGPVGARLSRTPLATPKGQGDGESDAEPGPGCPDCLAHQTSVGRFVPPPPRSSVLPDSSSAKPGDIGSGPISRGPPLVATA